MCGLDVHEVKMVMPLCFIWLVGRPGVASQFDPFNQGHLLKVLQNIFFMHERFLVFTKVGCPRSSSRLVTKRRHLVLNQDGAAYENLI